MCLGVIFGDSFYVKAYCNGINKLSDVLKRVRRFNNSNKRKPLSEGEKSVIDQVNIVKSNAFIKKEKKDKVAEEILSSNTGYIQQGYIPFEFKLQSKEALELCKQKMEELLYEDEDRFEAYPSFYDSWGEFNTDIINIRFFEYTDEQKSYYVKVYIDISKMYYGDDFLSANEINDYYNFIVNEVESVLRDKLGVKYEKLEFWDRDYLFIEDCTIENLIQI